MIYVKKRVLNYGGLANWAVLGNFIYSDDGITSVKMTRDIIDISGNVG